MAASAGSRKSTEHQEHKAAAPLEAKEAAHLHTIGTSTGTGSPAAHLHTRHLDLESVRMVFLSSRIASNDEAMRPMKMLTITNCVSGVAGGQGVHHGSARCCRWLMPQPCYIQDACCLAHCISMRLPIMCA